MYLSFLESKQHKVLFISLFVSSTTSSSSAGKSSGSAPSYAAPTQSSSARKTNVAGWGINSASANSTQHSPTSSSNDTRSRNLPTSSSSPLYQPSHVKLPHLNGITYLHNPTQNWTSIYPICHIILKIVIL